LDIEVPEAPTFDKFLLVELPDYELTKHDFTLLVTSMDKPYFWLEKALDSKAEGKIDTCVSFYLNGLRHTPTSTMLIYNLANSYKKLGKLKNAEIWFTLGCQLQPRWVDGQVGLGMTQFQMGDIAKAQKNIDQARSDFKQYLHAQQSENSPFKPLFTPQNLSIFLAIVSK
jgi:tetratricopeptide (TPR) repeat protein